MAIGVGVELSAGGLRAAVLERTGSATILRGAHEIACDATDPAALANPLTQLRRRLPRGAPIVLGLPSTSAILTVVTPLLVSAQRAQYGVQFELQQVVPFELAEAAWHYQWIGIDGAAESSLFTRARAWTNRFFGSSGTPAPRGGGGSGSPGAVVGAVRRNILEERLGPCRHAELPVTAVSLNALALVNAALARVPAGHAAAAALLHLLDAEAAEWIVWSEAGLAVVPVSAPDAAGLAAETAAAWDSLRGQLSTIPEVIWVVGDPGVWQALEPRIAAQIAIPMRRFELPPMVQASGTRLGEPQRWAAALGLALQAAGSVRMPLNLLAVQQHAARTERLRRLANLIAGLAAGAALVFGVVGMMGITRRRAHVLEVLARREQLYQSLRPDLRALLQRQQDLYDRTSQLEGAAVESAVAGQLLVKVIEALPDAAWLTTVQLTKTATLLEGQIEGRASTFQEVTQFFERLKSVAGLTTVKPLATTVLKEGDRESIAFNVQVQRALRPPPVEERAAR